MSNTNNLKPYISISAGDIIKRDLEYIGWSQEDLAQVTDISRKTLSSIMNAKQKLLLDHAKSLSDALGSSPEYWMNLDNSYWIYQSGISEDLSATERKARIRKYVPVLEIQKKGWREGGKTVEDFEATYQSIWDSQDPDFTFEVYEQEAAYCARRSKSDDEFTKYYSITWYQMARRNAEKIEVQSYNPTRLVQIADKLLTYTTSKDGISEVISDLNAAGVKFLVQSHLSKTYLDGACFFDKGNPVIIYTARYDRTDNFWFTLAHEISHVLLHFKKSTKRFILDDLADKSEKSKIEQEADRKAEEILHVDRILKLATPYQQYFSETNLQKIASEVGMDVSLLLGILQYHDYVDYRKLNKFKQPVKELFPDNIVVGTSLPA